MRSRAVVAIGIVLSLATACGTGRNAASQTALGAGLGSLTLAAFAAMPNQDDRSDDDTDPAVAAMLAGAGLAALVFAALAYDSTPEPVYAMAYVPPPPPPEPPPPPAEPPPPPVTINCTVCIFQ